MNRKETRKFIFKFFINAHILSQLARTSESNDLYHINILYKNRRMMDSLSLSLLSILLLLFLLYLTFTREELFSEI